MSAFAAEDAARQSADVGYPRDPYTGYRVPGTCARRRVFARLQAENYATLDNFIKKIFIISAFSTSLDGNIPEICCLKLAFSVDLTVGESKPV